jgi:hypothetical protein
MSVSEHREREAERFAAWAREPGHGGVEEVRS